MLLNITTTHYPATDLGYLLHKHPDKFQSFDLSVGKAHVFYPEKSEERTTVSLLLDIDPIDMVRNGRNLSGEGFALGHYVNDRPYVASSFMSVAIAKAFSSALNGKCKDKPELVDIKMPFEVFLPSVPVPKGGEKLIQEFFEPLGYTFEVSRHTLDTQFPEWGTSKYYALKLSNHLTIKDLLSHLYVLIPALDNDKHYFISHDEIDKLLEKGGDWLKQHPTREHIIRRYLIHLGSLSRHALSRITEGEESAILNDEISAPTESSTKKQTLHDKRIALVAQKLAETNAQKVLDWGCGEGKLIRELLKNKQFTHIAGTDVAYNELLKAKERLHFEEMSPKQKERINLFQSSIIYRDKRFAGFDAAAIVEVIEHLDLNRLKAFERVVFQYAQPKTVIITTPNKEYNIVWTSMDSEDMRHDDHRFEWTRAEFENWANTIAHQYVYSVSFASIGDEVENIGAPSQMAIFNKE